ncbi:uncharacterized protein [Mytilus edulis]|uniref:uncharacterized protein n=1 Tax=Mytilus edulis TaxID=6550 RepID=UPI0039EF33C9
MEQSKKPKVSSAERILQNKELKWQKRREQRRKSFHKNKPIATKTPKVYKENAGAIRQREYNERKRQKENSRRNRNEYMKDYRRRSSTLEISDNGEHDGVFSNRMDKARSIKKLKLALPVNSVKRAAVLSAYVDEKRTMKSPAVEKFRSSIEKEKIETSAIQSIKEIITSVKHKRNKDAIASLQLVASAVSGPNITNKKGAVKSLASKLGVNRKTIQKGKSFRAKVLHSGKSSFLYTSRKTRRHALDDTTKQLVHDFWLKESSSRPTNNKNDIKRVRLGPNIYSSHQCCILEKTQTEFFLDFIREYPEVKIGQRAFEKCKPYVVLPATQKDKLTCCCRHHVEMKSLFKSCMQFRKKTVIGKENCSFSVYGSLHELVDATLCPQSANTQQHKMSCLNRECTECGVDKLDFLPEELDKNGAVEVSWERYEYQNVKIKGDKVVRKLVLVKKRSNACDMFDYLKQLLEHFPSHQFRAYWQSKQMKSLINNLPVTHCVAIHDFSENYKCTEQCEIQSSYFQKQEVSIHVTILHRHAILEYDGIDSNENYPNIITEHFLVISPDQKHDHHFTHEVQKLIRDYLISISCDVSVMHEFTDGCSAQYKSRHCIGDISYGCSDLGYDKIVRNFFETSHARRPQDAAGGYIKKQADLSIIRGQRVIQSARNLYDFASENLCKTSEDAKCSRRIFRYIETINRNRNRYFKPVNKNRNIHQV